MFKNNSSPPKLTAVQLNRTTSGLVVDGQAPLPQLPQLPLEGAVVSSAVGVREHVPCPSLAANTDDTGVCIGIDALSRVVRLAVVFAGRRWGDSCGREWKLSEDMLKFWQIIF